MLHTNKYNEKYGIDSIIRQNIYLAVLTQTNHNNWYFFLSLMEKKYLKSAFQ